MPEIKKPENARAEQALIKTLLLLPDTKDIIFSQINGAMFWDRNNQLIFNTLHLIASKGYPLDEITLKGYLNSTYDTIGGDKYFNNLKQLDILPDNIPEYIKAVRDTYLLRMGIDAGLDIASTAMHANSPLDVAQKLIDYSTSFINNMSPQASIQPLGDILTTQWENYQARLANPGFTGIRTGIVDFDLQFGGLNPSDLVLVAGRASMGKTALLLSILLNQAKVGMPVALYSYEMAPEQIFSRLIAMESGVAYTNLITGLVDKFAQARIQTAFELVGSLPFFISYDVSSGVEQLVASASELLRRADIRVFGLDYIQRMVGDTDNRNVDLGIISSKLKTHSLKHSVVWLVASQLNRQVEYRQDKRPILADLRESGNLEQDADMVIMLYRDSYYNRNSNNAHLAEVLMRKNRNGPTSDLVLRFEQETMKFSSLEDL